MTDGTDNLDATSFKIIREMSKQDMIDEIIADFTNDLNRKDEEDLRHHIVHLRRANYTDRLMREAGFNPEDPPCNNGGHGITIFGG